MFDIYHLINEFCTKPYLPKFTVSGLHARIQKKGDSLLVTDLDSTNGTFIDEKRLRSGVVAVASPGSRITFGNISLI